MKNICKSLMFPVFHLLLKPLILADYKQRKSGIKADEWHWADMLAAKFGYFVEE